MSDAVSETVNILRENTYVDNLMMTRTQVEDLQKFKTEATEVLESGNFPVHKWESNVVSLESANMPNPGKILGHVLNKTEDTLKVQLQDSDDGKLTKRAILSRLGRAYDPLGIISPTMIEGKRIYRDSCEEQKSWNAEVSPALTRQWNNWTKQLRDIEVPWSLVPAGETKTIELHLFTDASALACSTVAIAVVDQDSRKSKGLLSSKSRLAKRNTSIPRLELVGGQMGANLARNLTRAFKRLPIRLVVIWMDSLVSLYWILNPGKPWKTFVSNRVKKIAEITEEVEIQWKYCPTEANLADLGSRGASLNKMEKGGWYEGPEWLLEQEKWPEQPNLKSSSETQHEEKPIREIVSFVGERQHDEFDELLVRRTYWSTIRITAWILRFVYNLRAKKCRTKKRRGPLTTDEVLEAQNCWIRREQKFFAHDLEQPGWSLVEDPVTKVLKCQGRIPNYTPIYLEEGLFVTKLIRHVHTRPQLIVSDNAAVFKATANWIRKIRKDEVLQNHLATQEIRWKFNLAKSPWCGGMYERLIREIKKTLYKTLGKTHLSFVQLEAVVIDIERHLNNRPLTYVESDGGDEEVLTPNSIVWGQQSHILQDIEVEDEELTKFNRRLVKAREHAWTRLRKEYIHGLMESHRINRAKSQPPEVGEIVLIVGEERNRGKWMKGKVTRIVKGVDGVARGVVLLHKGNRLERPLQAICPLEIRSVTAETVEEKKEEPIKPVRERRKAAVDAQAKIQQLAKDDDI